jgi:hypothetical protein
MQRATRSPRLKALGAAVAALALLAVLPATARGGVYVVAQCSPGVTGSTADAVFSRDSSHYVGSLACGDPTFKGVQIEHQGPQTASGRYGRWAWQAPSGTTLTAASLSYNVAKQDQHVPYLAIRRNSGNDVPIGLRFDRSWHNGGSPPVRDGAEFSARLFCNAPAGGYLCGAGSEAHVWIKKVRLTLNDSAPPSVALGGSLFDEGDRRGRQSVILQASDAGAGVALAFVVVNGKSAGAVPLPCATAHGLATRMIPCPLSSAPQLIVDTARPPFHDGVNHVSVCVSDYANQGAANTTCVSQDVVTDNSCPSSPVAGGATLGARFAPHAGLRATITSRQRIRVSGRLRNQDGGAVPGALICVQTRLAARGSAFRLIKTDLTDRSGAFSIRLPFGGSRAVRVEYRYDFLQLRKELRLSVHARPSFHVRPHRSQNEGVIHFRGKVPGPRNDNRVVVLQARGPGSDEWIRFKTPSTDSNGVFHARYRFGSSSHVAYRFRALLQPQRGYPYLRGVSRVRRVFVR